MLETKIAWISKIETRDDALEVVKVASIAFVFLAALQFVLFLVLKSTGAALDAAIMVVGALALYRLHSRAAAVILFALSCAEELITLANLFGAHVSIGSNVVLAGLMIWVAFRAVQATWALEQMPDEDDDEEVSVARGR